VKCCVFSWPLFCICSWPIIFVFISFQIAVRLVGHLMFRFSALLYIKLDWTNFSEDIDIHWWRYCFYYLMWCFVFYLSRPCYIEELTMWTSVVALSSCRVFDDTWVIACAWIHLWLSCRLCYLIVCYVCRSWMMASLQLILRFQLIMFFVLYSIV